MVHSSRRAVRRCIHCIRARLAPNCGTSPRRPSSCRASAIAARTHACPLRPRSPGAQSSRRCRRTRRARPGLVVGVAMDRCNLPTDADAVRHRGLVGQGVRPDRVASIGPCGAQGAQHESTHGGSPRLACDLFLGSLTRRWRARGQRARGPARSAKAAIKDVRGDKSQASSCAAQKAAAVP